ncbi:MAG: tRNA preQ1(34) S-adenosylmethionine ribosyltransferase-isomerase QueA [Lachnospiraceae bacterium]|nr:tRNA preQ1(34) S-adenosylmethionine ribosyltransferase-isomerase QueA [Lachnospiraceae bacterium]
MEELKKSDYFYELPEELIAQDPLEKRDDSRLLVLDRNTGETSHHRFSEVGGFLRPGDCLVLNDTKVIPARLIGEKEGSGGVIEILLLKRLASDSWEAIVRPGKKLREGARVSFGGGALKAEITEVRADGNRIVSFYFEGIFEEILDRLGEMPLPPYIKHKLKDPGRYQTVYAKNPGSAAAPTAGLHFTTELLDKLREAGLTTAFVTLHVGLGTFRPVKEENLLMHKMHSEYYEVSAETAATINRARDEGGRIIAVGTTSCRTLESVSSEDGRVQEGSGETRLFIYPGYRFKVIDGLITNFHLPESTLLMLVSAFAGRERVLTAYREAIKEGYRFFSFGDAMLVV